jgi:hypothetical protein
MNKDMILELIKMAIESDNGCDTDKPSEPVQQLDHPYCLGEPYFIRTVTHIYTGRLERVYEKELVLSDCAWIADTGRFADSLRDLSKLSEVEPFPDGDVVIGRGAILDSHVTSDTPRLQK